MIKTYIKCIKDLSVVSEELVTKRKHLKKMINKADENDREWTSELYKKFGDILRLIDNTCSTIKYFCEEIDKENIDIDTLIEEFQLDDKNDYSDSDSLYEILLVQPNALGEMIRLHMIDCEKRFKTFYQEFYNEKF